MMLCVPESGLEVAMDDALVVGFFEGLCDLQGDGGGFRRGQRTGAQFGCEGFASDQLHDDVVGAIVLDDVVDGSDVGMIKAGEHAGFAAEAVSRIFVGEDAGREHLDGDVTLEFFVARAIDDTHAACSKLAEDAIAIEEAGFGGGTRRWRRGFAREGRLGEESGKAVVFIEEILDELAELRIGAGLVEEGGALFGREVEDLSEKLFRSLLELIHRVRGASGRDSGRAETRRSTVPCD